MFSENPRRLFRSGGCVNFITGAGGLLQSILFGYGGIRFREDRIDVNPTKLPNTTSWAIRDVKYRGISFDVEVHGTNMVVHFKTLTQHKRLEVMKNEKKIEVSNNKINFRKGLATIAINNDKVGVNIVENNDTTSHSASVYPSASPNINTAVAVQQNISILLTCLVIVLMSLSI